jgi:hypothetical protein
MKTLAALAVFLLLVACDRPAEPLFPNSPTPTSTFAPPTTGPAVSPTPPAVPERPLPTSGPASEDCVDGWRTPEAGSGLASFPLRVIGRTVDLPADPVVVDMRYFTGPESPPSDKGYLLTIRRWYVKLYSEQDLTFQGRFLVESREFGSGVAAVAPYDTRGFRSPDWSGFEWDASQRRPSAYPGLPGRWTGVPYDFVRGSGDLTLPGLPPQVRGCLDTA